MLKISQIWEKILISNFIKLIDNWTNLEILSKTHYNKMIKNQREEENLENNKREKTVTPWGYQNTCQQKPYRPWDSEMIYRVRHK